MLGLFDVRYEKCLVERSGWSQRFDVCWTMRSLWLVIAMLCVLIDANRRGRRPTITSNNPGLISEKFNGNNDHLDTLDNGQEEDLRGGNREGRLFSLFNVVSFRNQACTSNSAITSTNGSGRRNGTCYTSGQCASRSGTASGSCAAGFGVCCVFTVSETGQSVTQNCTYIRNPNFPNAFMDSTAISNTVQKCCENVCQLRLDFETFSLLGTGNTVEGTDTDGDGTLDQEGGICLDMFDVTTTTGVTIPTICGENTGQHIYVDIGANAGDTATLNFNFDAATAFARNWEIKVTQVICGSESSAPQGCLQYHTEISGRFNSFNFQAQNDNHLQSQMYSVCVRQAEGFCCIQYLPCEDANSFSLDTKDVTDPTMPFVAKQDTDCTQDYIGIEASSTDCTGTGIGASQSRYCGTVLSSAPLGPDAVDPGHVPICDCSAPFRVDVVTDAMADVPAAPNMVQSRGVCLTWTQLPC